MNQAELNIKLFKSCIKGDLDIVKYLLTSPELTEHANIHHQDNDDKNALIWAFQGKYLNVVKYLLTLPDLTEHVNINHQDKDGWTALLYACRDGHLDVVKHLLTSPDLKEYADIHHQDNNYGWNALMLACYYRYFNIVEYLLLEYNMSVDKKTINWLEENHHQNIIQIIETRDLHNKIQDKVDSKPLKKRKKI